jgi:uncharacterized protein YjbI with pentapeptide repeats
VEEWNQWRQQRVVEIPDLHLAQLSGKNLAGANFNDANLWYANLSGATLSGAYLVQAYLRNANLSDANLREAYLGRADLSDANLSGANLSGANLSGANLARANLEGATLINCRIHGVSAWDVRFSNETEQSSLVVENEYMPYKDSFTVGDLENAQFIYLLRSSEKSQQIERIRQVMAAVDLEDKDIANRTATELEPPSSTVGATIENEETSVMAPTEVEQEGPQNFADAKRNIEEAMVGLSSEAKEQAFIEMMSAALSTEEQQGMTREMVKRVGLGPPSSRMTDRIWLMIVGSFATVFVLSAVALMVGVLLDRGTELQILLTVVTTVAGVLAGFISGRASTGENPS